MATWNKNPTYDTSKDIEFFSDVENETGTLRVPFAVIEVYSEAVGGGGGGGKSHASPEAFPDDAASGGGGGAWCYKTWDVNRGDELDYEVGKGGKGATSIGVGEDGGDSKVIYSTGLNVIPMVAGGGTGGTISAGVEGGRFENADGGINGQDTDTIISTNKDARGGRGGGAAGLGAGSRTNGNFTVSWSCCSQWQGDGDSGGQAVWTCLEFTEYTTDLEAKICGGPGGNGAGVGGTLFESGPDADTTPEGYYRVNGKDGGRYGGGGGGNSGGHDKTSYSGIIIFGSEDGWDDLFAATGANSQYGGPLFFQCASTTFYLSNTKKLGDGGDGAGGFVYLAANYKEPEIINVEIPTQYNLQGDPTKTLTCNFQTKYASEVWLVTSGGVEMFRIVRVGDDGEPDKVPDGSKVFTSLLQSNVEQGNSPACDTFTFYAKGPGGEVSQPVEGCVFNDDCIRDIVIPSSDPLNPGQKYEVSVRIEDIDMPTRVQISSGATFDIDFQGDSFSNSLVENNQTIIIKTEALPFCTDERGLQHYRNMYIEFGTGDGDCEVKRYDFRVVTRAPVVAEAGIDFTDNNISFPYPKIDTTDAVPTAYLSNNNGPVPIQDIELADPYGVQVRVLDTEFSTSYTKDFTDIRSQQSSQAQARINRSATGLQDWKNPNIIGVNELPPADGPCQTNES